MVGRPGSMPWNGFCRGIEVTLEFDEEQYVGSGVFLFASVLERFLGLYCVAQLVHPAGRADPSAQGALKRWPPRAGEQILL